MTTFEENGIRELDGWMRKEISILYKAGLIFENIDNIK